MLNLFDFVFLRFTFFRLQSLAVYMRILVGIFILVHLNWWCVDTNTEKTRLFFFFVGCIWIFRGYSLIHGQQSCKYWTKKNVESDTFDVFCNTNKLCSNIAFIWHKQRKPRSTCTGNGKKLIIWHVKKSKREKNDWKKSYRITEKRAVKLPAFWTPDIKGHATISAE